MASLLMQRWEKKFGKDEHKAIPRCMMAARFKNELDPSGETMLQHWIKAGQIQDLSIKSLDLSFLDVKDFTAHRLPDLIV